MAVPSPIMIVGGGRMGEAIASGILATRTATPGSLIVAEPDDAAREEIASSLGVRVVQIASDAASEARVIIIAVKPQVLDRVVEEFASSLGDSSPIVISIAAGVTCERLEGLLPPGTTVVRVMPNTPAMVGQGISALSPGAMADEAALETAVEVFSALGKVVVVEEELQDAVTGVSGSGPAYVALFVEAMTAGGVAEGLAPETSYQLALQTLAGTAALLERTGQTPAELVEAVSSPGGTTMAARAELDASGFADSVHRAVRAAVARSKELGLG